MSEINSQTYLGFSGSFIPERDINGNLLSITSSQQILNDETQFFEVGTVLGYYTSSYLDDTVDKTFSELLFTDDNLNIRIPPGAVLISESQLLELEETIILLESQVIELYGEIEYLHNLTGSLYHEIEQLYEYINLLLGGGTGSDLHIITDQLPHGKINTFYGAQLTAVGGITPYTWSILSGSLPPNITLNGETGEITGTPVLEYDRNMLVQVADSSDIQKYDTKTIGLKINPEDPLGGYLTIITNQQDIPDAISGQNYTFQFLATGGTGNYIWSIPPGGNQLPIDSSGGVPSGLILTSDGLLTGNYTGTFNKIIEFVVKDDNIPQQVASKDFRIKVILGP